MPKTLHEPEYEPQAQVRKVDKTGHLHFNGQHLRTSKAFAGKRLALRATNQDGLFDLCYRRHVLTQIDLRQDSVKTVHHVSEQVSTFSPV